MSLEENVSDLNQEVINKDLQSAAVNIEPIDPDDEKKKLAEARKLKNWNNSAKYGVEESINMSSWGNGADIRKIQSYSERSLGEFGYSTLFDINKTYNENTSRGEEFNRQIQGMWELADIGFTDTFGFGLLAEDDNAVDFMNVMNTYSSSREGAMSTFGNALLSSGYTIGIINAIAAEEFLLTLGTAFTGGIGGGAQVAETAALGARATVNYSKFQKGLTAIGKTYDKVGDKMNYWKKARNLGEARVMSSSARYTTDWFKGRAIQGVGLVGKGFRGAMPISGTAGFLRNLDKLSEVNTTTKVALGAGALARDGRKFYLAHSESKLESDINKNENLEHATSQWYKDNPGEIMPLSVYQDFQEAANLSAAKVYSANFYTIYTSNAIALDNLMKPMSSLALRTAKANAAKYGSGGIKAVSRGLGKVTFEAIESGLDNWIKNLSWKGTAKAVGSFVTSSSGEGLQEVAQDIYQAAGKEYFGHKFLDLQNQDSYGLSKLKYNDTGLKARANFYSSTYDALTGGGIYNGKSAATWESFISGFLIGFVAGPTNIVTQTVTDYTVGNKNYIWSSKASEAHQKDLEKRKEVAEILTAFHNDSGNFIAEQIKENLTASINSHSEMLKAIRNKNDMAAHDSKSDFFRYGLEKALEHGFEQEFIDHFNQMSEMTIEELNQATNRKDITEENKSDVINTAQEYVNRIKNYKKNFDERNSNPGFLNPYSIQGLDFANPENIKTILNHQAWELMRSDYIFNRDAINDFAQRVDKMKSQIKENSNITDSELNTLVSDELLEQEINVLEQSIKENEEYSTKENKLNETQDAIKQKRKLDSLKKIQKAYEILNKRAKLIEAGEVRKSTTIEREAYALLFEGFNEYINNVDNAEDSSGRRAVNKNKFKFLWDIPILIKRSKRLENHALSLLDKNYREDFHESLVNSLTYLDQNKKQFIEESLEALSQRKAAKEIVEQLVANNIIFSLKEIDDLLEKGIMPSRIFNLQTNEDATKEEYNIALKIIEGVYNNLTGKQITASKGLKAISNKYDKDKRTAADLLKQYKNVTTVSELIEAMLTNNNNLISTQDIEFLTLLASREELKDIKIEISDNLDEPIETKKTDDGITIAFDVRFSGSDYTGGKTRFEALLLSGILNGQLNGLLKSNEEFKISVESVMVQVREGYKTLLNSNAQTRKDLTEKGWSSAEEYVESIPYMNEPVLFLSQALHSQEMRGILESIEDVDSVDTSSLEEVFNEKVKDALETAFDSTEGNLLEKVISLASMSFSSETLQDISEQVQAKLDELGISLKDWTNLNEKEKEEVLTYNCK